MDKEPILDRLLAEQDQKEVEKAQGKYKPSVDRISQPSNVSKRGDYVEQAECIARAVGNALSKELQPILKRLNEIEGIRVELTQAQGKADQQATQLEQARQESEKLRLENESLRKTNGELKSRIQGLESQLNEAQNTLQRQINAHIEDKSSHRNKLVAANRDDALIVRQKHSKAKEELVKRAIEHYITQMVGQTASADACDIRVSMAWVLSAANQEYSKYLQNQRKKMQENDPYRTIPAYNDSISDTFVRDTIKNMSPADAKALGYAHLKGWIESGHKFKDTKLQF